MSFTDVAAECAKAKKSVVIRLRNQSSKTLTLATSNLLQGKWQIEPPKSMDADSEHIVAIKTVGAGATVQGNFSFAVGNDKKRKYMVSFANTPAKQDVSGKVISQYKDDADALKVEFGENMLSDAQVQVAVVYRD